MDEWVPTKLAELIEIVHGFAFKGEYFSDEPPGDILLTPGNFAIGGGFQWGKKKFYRGPVPAEYVLSPGDVLVTMTDLSKSADTLGFSAVVPPSDGRLLHNQRLGKILIKSSRTTRSFIKWVLRSPGYRNEVLASYTGSTVKHTSPGRILAYEFPLPPIHTQDAISHLLDELEAKTELNRRMNDTLEAMARAIFRDWFVDFGPTRAKQESRSAASTTGTANNTARSAGGTTGNANNAGREPYLAPEIWSLFPDRLDTDGKPEGWDVGQLDDVLVLQRGFDLPKTSRTDGPYTVMAASGPNGTHQESMVPGPGVTTGRSGVLGNVFFIHEDFWPLNTSLWVKHFKLSSPVHAYFLLQTLDLAGFNAGSAVPTLNRNHVHNIPQILAPIKIIEAFNELVMPLFDRQRTNRAETDTLIQTRDLLLPKLMSGEICIKDAEKIAEAAA